MKIALTDTMGPDHKFQRYTDWLRRGSGTIECVKLSYVLDNGSAMDSCDALILTGGHDVDPLLYGGAAGNPAIVDIDRQRDEFERRALQKAIDAQIPVLGICRGLQVANVHFGGSLLPDIEAAGYRSHRSNSDVENRHAVSLDRDSVLSKVSGVVSGSVNSSHHQAASRIGEGLKVVARSDDGIIEAIEMEESARMPFFLLVQWHPERMPDFANPLSSTILKYFLSAASNERITTAKADRES